MQFCRILSHDLHWENKHNSRYVASQGGGKQVTKSILRWLDRIFQGQYLPSFSINYVAINEGLKKLSPQLY